MAWERVIEVPLSQNQQRTVRIPGGDELKAAPGPADFPSHAVVSHSDENGRSVLRVRFIYRLSNEEGTFEEAQGAAKIRFGTLSGRVFEFEVPVSRDLTRVALRFDVEAAAKSVRQRHQEVSARELVHYTAMRDLLPYVQKRAAEKQEHPLP